MQPVMTWPEGNGRIIAHLQEQLRPCLRHSHGVYRLLPDPQDAPSIQLHGHNVETQRPFRLRARRVIVAARAVRCVAPVRLAEPNGRGAVVLVVLDHIESASR